MSTHDPIRTTAAIDPWRGWNPFDPEQRDSLHERLRLLREGDPVNESPLGLWRLTRYHDVVRLLHDLPAGVRTLDGQGYRATSLSPDDPREQFMLLQDPPTHTRLRKLVSRAFTPRAVEDVHTLVQRVVDDCLDGVAGAGAMDVVSDLALPVPATVICEMLGVPVSDRDRFTRWTADATHGLSPNPFIAPEILERAGEASAELMAYFTDLIAERRKRLTDDLLSTLIRAEEEGDRLSASELLSQSIGLLIAGFETTIGLISNGVKALIEHPDELARLAADPSLATPMIDECLRYDGPIVATLRILHADATFEDKTIPTGSIVIGVLAAANRDPAVFPEPDRFDITRTPNEHLAFGGGVHFCLGAHLARLEGRLAISTLVDRFEGFELDRDGFEWGASLFRVPGRLPIAFRARR
jgi:cytochrome P450